MWASHDAWDEPARTASPLTRYLLLVYLLLVVYASLHPLSGWRDQGMAPWAWLAATWPRHVTPIDLGFNIAAYLPVGLLLVAALYPWLRGWRAVALGTLGCSLLSLGMESLQVYLPSRVPSVNDLLTNSSGGLIGALLADWLVGRWLARGALRRWRYRLFHAGHSVDLGLVLLLLWLLTQLTPETLLFGAGDLRDVLSDVPGVLHPAQTFIRAEAVVAAANALAVGLLASTLLRQRIDIYRGLLLLFGAALLVRTLAYAVLGSDLLSSTADALSWLTPGAASGALAGIALTLLAALLPRNLRLMVAALALMAATVVVNLAPPNPYHAATLSVWRQGHFLNFNGLTRWLSMAWPFAAMAWIILSSGTRQRGIDSMDSRL